MRYAAVAQLDRVFGYEPKGRGFESLQPYQKNLVSEKKRGFSLTFFTTLFLNEILRRTFGAQGKIIGRYSCEYRTFFMLAYVEA